MKPILCILSFIVLSACSSTSGISVYSLNNNELESVIQRAIPDLSQELKVMQIPVDFKVDNIKVEIGPDQRQVVALYVESTASISAFIINYPIKLNVSLEGSPKFDSDKDAIYLTEVKLINASVDAAGYKGNIKALNREVVDLLNDYLKDNPVYTLDKNDPTQSLLAKIPLNLSIQEGSLKLTPSF